MSSRNGQIQGYTGFFPIIEETRSQSHAEELRGLLAALPTGEGSLFSRTRLVHGARLFIIDDVVYNGHPTREEHLAYGYLAMSLTFDGELAALAEGIAALGAPEFDRIFSHCYGYEGAGSSVRILAYLEACRVETAMLYVDVDDASLEETLKALHAHARIARMIESGQGKSPSERKALVRALAVLIGQRPPPPPGAFCDERSNEDRPL
jgi:hypothetical protein